MSTDTKATKETSGLLTREQILDVPDIKFETVEVPEWGGSVRVRSLSAQERDSFEIKITDNEMTREERLGNMRARLVALACVDANGLPIFEEADVRKLGKKNAAALERVFTVASGLSGISKDDQEQLAKNSKTAQSVSSSTD